MHVQEWLDTVPAAAIYALVGLVIGVESLGVPLPGEIILISATLLASQQAGIDPVILGTCAAVGAIIGDSFGYIIGRRGGRPLLAWLGAKFPRHFSEAHVATAERSFQKWGVWAVFFGRFIALLRIFAGPLSGVLKMPYWKFLIANVFGGIVWAGGTVAAIYYIGVVAEDWLKRFSWAGLGIAVLVGVGSMVVVRRRSKKSKGEASAGPEAVAEVAGGPDAASASAPMSARD